MASLPLPLKMAVSAELDSKKRSPLAQVIGSWHFFIKKNHLLLEEQSLCNDYSVILWILVLAELLLAPVERLQVCVGGHMLNLPL